MTYPNSITAFVSALTQNCPEAKVEIDVPRDPKGEWLVDIWADQFHTAVSWRPNEGFGLFVSPDHGFGDRPDEIYKKPGLAAKRVCGLIAPHSGTRSIGIMRLRELRQLVGTPQTQLAESLEINQAAVSRFESRQDILISSLAHYIEAIGGRLEMRARFDEFEVRIDPMLEIRKKVGA